jgi:hypothetical protein
MNSKTVAELRALARAEGIKGYSRMRKDELMRALSAARRRPRLKTAKGPKKIPTKGRKAPAVRKKTARVTSRAPSEPEVHLETHTARLTTEEERIEDAKFAVMPLGTAASAAGFARDLDEDIESLPPLPGPSLTLLPQKPGVIYAYWELEPAQRLKQPGLRFRLCHIGTEGATVLEELAVAADSGRWYFHIDPALRTDELYLQLGYYSTDRQFVTATSRGIVRVPRLHPSARTDRDWWVSEEDFRRMYLRAGGRAQGKRLSWPGSASSSR